MADRDATERPLLDSTTRALTLLARRTQAEGRVPGLLASVARRGEIVWSAGVGLARVDDPSSTPDIDTRFVVASNTKSFVAAVLAALRDEGALRFDDPIGAHLDIAHADVTVRSMLSHAGGLASEPVGDVWDDLRFPDAEGLLDGFKAARRIGAMHHRWHYSNLAYSVLGLLVAHLDGADWYTSVRRRILDPLRMVHTTLGPPDEFSAGAYTVSPWADLPIPEPIADMRAMAPAGGLMSTARDMARWGGFLADPDPAVLSPETVDEMCTPVAFVSQDDWSGAYGLGVQLVRRRGRTWVGHTGGMPGAVTGVFTDRATGVTASVFMNVTGAPSPSGVAVELGEVLLEHEPELPPVWEPGTSIPDGLASVLGQWFSEGRRHVFSVRHGELRARSDRDGEDVPPSRFAPLDRDTYVTIAGGARGELLRLERAPDGTVRRMRWATYPFTRDPGAFGEP